jgi:hypothetical protein
MSLDGSGNPGYKGLSRKLYRRDRIRDSCTIQNPPRKWVVCCAVQAPGDLLRLPKPIRLEEDSRSRTVWFRGPARIL